ncbi:MULTISPECIES: ABC transporter permease [unclassified Bradyrhizobium]|uniref:ABC transporter permease n=1 Tax=unclassified Bradyrhizobium TaxID=2631580 RepID=UPI002915D621|nr:MULTISPECIES: ABC transporter permease [unclassified Bradyrhizobium]
MAGPVAIGEKRAEDDAWKERYRREWSRVIVLSVPLSFVLLTFVWPIFSILLFAIRSTEVSDVLPQTSALLLRWDGLGVPPASIRAVLLDEAGRAFDAKTLSRPAMRLNHEMPGFSSLLLATGRAAAHSGVKDPAGLVEIDRRWEDRAVWIVLRRAAMPYTAHYLLTAHDLMRDWSGRIVRIAEDRRIYVSYLQRTIWIATIVTLACLCIGYPIAYIIASSTPRAASIMLMFVLVPFWTSLLVRTAAWTVLLQPDGILNDALNWLGLWGRPLDLLFTRAAVYISMVHIMLPFMILCIYSVMKGIPPQYMRAAQSLGASPFVGFLKVYFPLTLPGVGAGSLLVFVTSLGFYITPGLLGGSGDQMHSSLIARFALNEANWAMAASLSVTLLVSVTIAVLMIGPLFRVKIAGFH